MNSNEVDAAVKGEFEGAAGGLYGEVVTMDSYGIKSVGFVPDVVFDFGGNIGIFARFARQLYPNVKVVSVEPDEDNIRLFKKHTNDLSIHLIEAALGKGGVYRAEGATNGAHECYVSAGLGYPFDDLKEHCRYQPMMTKVVSLLDVVKSNWEPGMKAVVKLDCEGAENCIWEDAESVDLLRQMDYIAIELHYYAIYGGEIHQKMKEVTDAVLKSLKKTHHCDQQHVIFTARKKS